MSLFCPVYPEDHTHLQPRAQQGTFVGIDEEKRSFRVVLDGARKFVVARSVFFYEQSLVHAMGESIGMNVSEGSSSHIHSFTMSDNTYIGGGVQFLSSFPEHSDPNKSLADALDLVEPKSLTNLGR